MRIIRTAVAGFIFLLLNLFSISSLACSLADGYLRPSNYDLVKEADAILLAEAVSFDRTPGGVTRLPEFTFKILEVIKGDFTEDFLTQGGVDTYLGKSDENDFSDVRPGAGTGACNAYDYQIGKKFLLFVNKTRAGWSVSGAPFSRINEEVSGVDSPWTMAVRQYARIGSLNNYDAEKSELKKLQENARRGKEAKKYPAGLVKDIDYYFKSPYSSKSYQDLLALYNSSAKEGRRKVLWAFAWGKHPEAKFFIRDLLRSGNWEEFLGPVSEYVKQTKDHSLFEPLADGYLKIKDKQRRWPLMWALIEVADEHDSELMLAALKSADEEEAGRLAVWFVRHPVAEATEIIRKLVDAKYQERWELAFSLAGLGDEGALEGAKVIIKGPDKDRWVGYYIIARSPLPGADKLAKAIIQDNDPKALSSLIQGYGESFNPNRWERLHDLINLQGKAAEVDYWLRRTLEEMAARGDDKAAALVGIMK